MFLSVSMNGPWIGYVTHMLEGRAYTEFRYVVERGKAELSAHIAT